MMEAEERKRERGWGMEEWRNVDCGIWPAWGRWGGGRQSGVGSQLGWGLGKF